MTYNRWKKQFEKQALRARPAERERLHARLWNLENELRIPRKTSAFRGFIARKYGSLRRNRKRISAGQTALDALNAAIEATRTVKSKWLGALPIDAARAYRRAVCTHIPLLTLNNSN